MFYNEGYFNLRCDKCGYELEEEEYPIKMYETIPYLRRNAERRGWTFDRDKAYCPGCKSGGNNGHMPKLGEPHNVSQEEAYEMAALAKVIGLEEEEIDGSIRRISAHRYEAYGDEYYAGSAGELSALAECFIAGCPEIWREAVAAGRTELGLAEWARECVSRDGFATVLNPEDGISKKVTIGGKDIEVCRG